MHAYRSVSDAIIVCETLLSRLMLDTIFIAIYESLDAHREQIQRESRPVLHVSRPFDLSCVRDRTVRVLLEFRPSSVNSKILVLVPAKGPVMQSEIVLSERKLSS